MSPAQKVVLRSVAALEPAAPSRLPLGIGSGIASVDTALRRRLAGDYEVDAWGLDTDLVGLLSPLLGLRWDVRASGHENLPASGPALLVFNRRAGISEPFVMARAVRQATGRFVRPVGVPDVAPLGPALRRLGGVLDRVDEVAGLLRASALVALPAEREPRAGRAGKIDPGALAVARFAGVPVHPVALHGRETGRRWRVQVGAEVSPPRERGPLADAQFADACGDALQALLDGGGSGPGVSDPRRGDR